jgi:hypothetical protein
MRILLDVHGMPWSDAWRVTEATFSYTNHTLLPEALEKWPLAWFEMLLPRQLEIILEINRRLLAEVQAQFPGDNSRLAAVSLVEEGDPRKIRMANLAIVGSHSTNGVAAIHSDLLRKTTVKDLAEIFPDRFSNKTNGVTPRRWLLLANPPLAQTITDAIGSDWITDLSQLSRLKSFANDSRFQNDFRQAKREAKLKFVDWLKANPDKGSAGTSGVGSNVHLTGVLFQKETGTHFRSVPYRGSAPAMQDLVSGQIDILFDTVLLAVPQMRAGRIKIFAVTAKNRLASAPEIPTVDEAGLPGFYVASWHGFWVRRGSPKEVIAKLNAAVVEALADPSVRSRIADIGLEIFPREQQTPEALRALQKAEIEKWWPIIKAAGIKVSE